MYTIQKNIENIVEIKHSKFITKLFKVKSIEEIETILEELKKEHSDATHICYAYKIENIAKFSDDGEPGGTAGLPMMEVLIKKEMDFILAVVIRYFGGIKLGSGGLVRAYSSGVADSLKLAVLQELVPGYEIKIVTNYENMKRLDYILKDILNIKKEFLESVTYILEVDKEFFKSLEEFNPIILKEILIEKDIVL